MFGNSVSFYIKLAIAIVLLIGIAGYAFYRSTDLRHGPQVEITSPINGATLTESPINIIGTAQNISFISLNDLPIFIDEKGNWKEKRLLSPGYNIFTVKAKDKFGREIVRTLEVVYQKVGVTTTTP